VGLKTYFSVNHILKLAPPPTSGFKNIPQRQPHSQVSPATHQWVYWNGAPPPAGGRGRAIRSNSQARQRRACEFRFYPLRECIACGLRRRRNRTAASRFAACASIPCADTRSRYSRPAAPLIRGLPPRVWAFDTQFFIGFFACQIYILFSLIYFIGIFGCKLR
jgi:hypothetical protein